MTDTLFITKINGLILRQDYVFAFSSLESFPFEEWIKLLPKVDAKINKKDWLRGDSGKYFWSHYIHTSKYFSTLFSSVHAETYLNSYFNSSFINNELIQKLGNEFPELLLKAIKRNRAFLKQIHYASLTESIKNIDFFKEHILVFNILNKRESVLWKDFEKSIEDCLKCNSIEVLFMSANWLEYQRNELFKNKHSLEQSNNVISSRIEVLNQFFSYYFHRLALPELDKNLQLSEKEIENIFEKSISSLYSIVGNEIFKSLEKISNWYDFTQRFIEPYCFDDNFYYVNCDDALLLEKKSNLVEFNYTINGIKYQEIQQYYRDLCLKIGVDNLGINIKGKNQLEYEINKELAIWLKAAILFANEIHVNHLVTKDKKIIDIELIGNVIINFIGNAIIRFYNPTNDFYSTQNQNFPDKVICAIIQTKQLPLRFDSKEVWLKMSEKFLPDNTVNANDVLSLLTVSPYVMCPKSYSRFNPMINLWTTPFIEIGGYIFSFNTVLSLTQNIGFSLIENAMDNNLKGRDFIQKAETEQMEIDLAERFTKANFKLVRNSIKIRNIDNSDLTDIDLLVYEDGVLIIGELKRTKLRLTASDIYQEEINNTKKAIEQLEKSIKYIIEHPEKIKEWLGLTEIPNIKREDIIALIISTSPENDGKIYKGGYRKTLFFDVIHLLARFNADKIRQLGKNPLDEFYNLIYYNYRWKEIIGNTEIPEIIPGILPLNNEPMVINIMNKAAILMNRDKFNDAIILYKNLIETFPSIPYFYQLLAEAYFENKEYQNTVTACDDGLKIRIDDILLLQYKSSSLYQLNNWDGYFNVLQLLNYYYPFKHPIEMLEYTYNEGVSKGLFSNEFLKSIKE